MIVIMTIILVMKPKITYYD